MNEYQAYKLYLSIKRHFEEPGYDAIKYCFKTNATVKSYSDRTEKPYFKKLAKHKDPLGLLLSNVTRRDTVWIGELFDHRSDEAYSDWSRIKSSLSYTFQQEIKGLGNKHILVTDGDYPALYREYRKRNVSLETVTILDKLLNFLLHWNKSIDDSILWPRDYLKILKYKPFIKFDEKKFRAILKSNINNL